MLSFALFVYINHVILFSQDSVASARARAAKEAESSAADLTYKTENEEGPAPTFDDLGPTLHTCNIPGTTNAASRP